MKNTYKLAILTAALSPAVASAQLINITDPATSGAFQSLVSLMALDSDNLKIGPLSNNLVPYNEFHWDADGGSFNWGEWNTSGLSGNSDDINFQLVATNQDYFFMRGDIDIGLVAFENWNDDELFVSAYDVDSVGTADPKASLFRYSDQVGGDAEGETRGLTLNTTEVPVVLEFSHLNNTTGSPELVQGNELRFTMFRQVITDEFANFVSYGSEWILALNDNNGGFDGDVDDGIFYISGDISPVPEPSQIAALALFGLGGLLYIRKRMTKKA